MYMPLHAWTLTSSFVHLTNSTNSSGDTFFFLFLRHYNPQWTSTSSLEASQQNILFMRWGGVVSLMPNPQPQGQGICCFDLSGMGCPTNSYATAIGWDLQQVNKSHPTLHACHSGFPRSTSSRQRPSAQLTGFLYLDRKHGTLRYIHLHNLQKNPTYLKKYSCSHCAVSKTKQIKCASSYRNLKSSRFMVG